MPTKSKSRAKKITKKVKVPAKALLARSQTKPEPPTEEAAATAIARAWLAKGGFHEDPTGESPERIEIHDAERGSDEYGGMYVTVHVFIPDLDIEHVVDGTHPDGISVEGT